MQRPSKVLLVGESNPYSRDPDDALLPWPREASGNRLRLILGMTDEEYLAAFTRRNLLPPLESAWSAPRVTKLAAQVLTDLRPGVVVALGKRVAAAFGRVAQRDGYEPAKSFECRRLPRGNGRYYQLVALPHPSGRSRAWNAPGTQQRARDLVKQATERWATERCRLEEEYQRAVSAAGKEW